MVLLSAEQQRIEKIKEPLHQMKRIVNVADKRRGDKCQSI